METKYKRQQQKINKINIIKVKVNSQAHPRQRQGACFFIINCQVFQNGSFLVTPATNHTNQGFLGPFHNNQQQTID